MKLYDLALSGHSHRVRLLASLLNITIELVPVDLLNGAHKQPDYLAKNPFGQVPTLVDGDVTLYDSNAILVYLASRFDPARTWLPESPELAAQVQIWLSKAANELASGPGAARLIAIFGAPLDKESVQAKSHALFAVMNQHLAERTWFVGQTPTIADVALYSYTAHAPEGGIDLREYPHIVRWVEAIERLPGFVAMPDTDTDAKLALEN